LTQTTIFLNARLPVDGIAGFFSMARKDVLMPGPSDPFKENINYKIESPDIVKKEVLQPLAYAYSDKRDIYITIHQPEYTSVCPMTGLPDYANITIIYRPNKKIIELKSLKFYLLQYRNVGIFYEHLVNRILDDLVDVLAPQKMEIIGEFTARGGITSKVVATYEGEK
jgi:7-cyano-7-deazaguanine reductase